MDNGYHKCLYNGSAKHLQTTLPSQWFDLLPRPSRIAELMQAEKFFHLLPVTFLRSQTIGTFMTGYDAGDVQANLVSESALAGCNT